MKDKDLGRLESGGAGNEDSLDHVFFAASGFLADLSGDDSAQARDISVKSGELVLCNSLSSRVVAELLGYCLGALSPPRASLFLFGEDLGRISKRRSARLRRRIGVCGGPLCLDNELTVTGNIALPCQLKRLSAKQTSARVARVAEALALDELLPLKTSRLGFAERRIVAVARALAHDPELALLEDPLAGVSGERRELLAAYIHRLAVTGAAVIVFNDQSRELSESSAQSGSGERSESEVQPEREA